MEIEMRGINKSFGNNAVLKNAGFVLSTGEIHALMGCLLYTSPSPRDRQKSRMPSSA